MPTPSPKALRDDVVAIALKQYSSRVQIAQDFGISESCVRRWGNRVAVDGGRRSGVTSRGAAENRELRKLVMLIEQEVWMLRRAAAYLS